jgi:flavin-dependent thymidylate synthase
MKLDDLNKSLMTNTVELLGHYGNDLTHGVGLVSCSAWTSTSRELTDEKISRVPKLLTMLASEGHHTPFEKSSLHFLVTVDQATHIHLLKHRIGVSINGESARYKELKEDKMYIPYDWSNTWHFKLKEYTEQGNKLYHEALEYFTPILGRKRAKESARFFKTFNSQITMDLMFNWRSFAHFQQLRNSEHAQVEVRQLAQDMLDQVKNIEGNPFEHTINAFNLNK